MDTKSVEIDLSKYSTQKVADDIGHETLSLIVNRNIHVRSLQDLAFLKELLEKVGIQIKAFDYPDTNLLALTFNIDYAQYTTITKRKAGRKINYNKEQENGYTTCTIEKLHEILKTNPNKSALAAELGCNRATLYRIIKNLENNGWYEGDSYYRTCSIWSHTS